MTSPPTDLKGLKIGFLPEKTYRQYIHYYYVHVNYLFDKAKLYLAEVYMVLRFKYFQDHGQFLVFELF